jgi:uncharacterized protein DUF2252
VGTGALRGRSHARLLHPPALGCEDLGPGRDDAAALFSLYGELCGWTLARAHARSGDSIAIGSYMGTGEVFDRAMLAFAQAYASQNEADFKSLREAVESRRVEAHLGL